LHRDEADECGLDALAQWLWRGPVTRSPGCMVNARKPSRCCATGRSQVAPSDGEKSHESVTLGGGARSYPDRDEQLSQFGDAKR
jgi:hypothetical protein